VEARALLIALFDVTGAIAGTRLCWCMVTARPEQTDDAVASKFREDAASPGGGQLSGRRHLAMTGIYLPLTESAAAACRTFHPQ
jgi:hypothetical protein